MLGTGTNAVTVVAALEMILAVYSVALVFNAKSRVLKIVHIVLTVFWVVLALLNVFYR